mmetsp:Transcript_3845/g.24372  ORF Transcript_3845/g.24372 Transcript_3845/m.24372 type:complete len:83 (+) Transcript_3845:4796-5044(+)
MKKKNSLLTHCLRIPHFLYLYNHKHANHRLAKKVRPEESVPMPLETFKFDTIDFVTLRWLGFNGGQTKCTHMASRIHMKILS